MTLKHYFSLTSGSDMSSNGHENYDDKPVAGRPPASAPRTGAAGRSASSSVPGSSSISGSSSVPASSTTSSSVPLNTADPKATKPAQAVQGKKGTPTDTAGKPGKPGKSTSGDDWSVFRTVVVLVGVVIALFGAYYLIRGTAGLPDTEANPVNPTLESQFRFFAAVMVGLGAAFITIAIKFEWANMLWLVCLMVFVGGIGRVLSWAFSGTPHYLMIILMVVELAFPAALLVWHKYIAKTSELRREFAERS